jgi:uncharacterized coiled-coil DUF342 family protein
MKNPITDQKFNELLQSIRDLQAQHKEINFKSKGDVERSFKIIAFQQFQLQTQVVNIHFERQLLLYLE